jgi:hypothetical protein
LYIPQNLDICCVLVTLIRIYSYIHTENTTIPVQLFLTLHRWLTRARRITAKKKTESFRAMGGLFSKDSSKKKSENRSISRDDQITEKDRAILDLKNARDRLNKYKKKVRGYHFICQPQVQY